MTGPQTFREWMVLLLVLTAATIWWCYDSTVGRLLRLFKR